MNIWYNPASRAPLKVTVSPDVGDRIAPLANMQFAESVMLDSITYVPAGKYSEAPAEAAAVLALLIASLSSVTPSPVAA